MGQRDSRGRPVVGECRARGVVSRGQEVVEGLGRAGGSGGPVWAGARAEFSRGQWEPVRVWFRRGLRSFPRLGTAAPAACLSPICSPQPVPNHNPWMLLYFISFLLIVSFFVLNMFVGVVVENFHKCRQHQEAEEARRREEKRLRRLEKKRRSEWVACSACAPILRVQWPRPGCHHSLRALGAGREHRADSVPLALPLPLASAC